MALALTRYCPLRRILLKGTGGMRMVRADGLQSVRGFAPQLTPNPTRPHARGTETRPTTPVPSRVSNHPVAPLTLTLSNRRNRHHRHLQFFELKEPVWESDKHMVACNTCGDKFSFIIRKVQIA